MFKRQLNSLSVFARRTGSIINFEKIDNHCKQVMEYLTPKTADITMARQHLKCAIASVENPEMSNLNNKEKIILSNLYSTHAYFLQATESLSQTHKEIEILLKTALELDPHNIRAQELKVNMDASLGLVSFRSH
jgi:hypothetical protein